MSLKELFGEASSLLKGKDGKVQVESLQAEGNVVGLYFSAHWCPPCRAFTPELAEWYKKFKKTTNGSKFDIVFVSSDRDQGSFDEYYGEMPWLALPYDQRDMKSELSKKFKVSGIPTLAFLYGDTGKLITSDGRAIVMEDPEGADFPWIPKKFTDIIPGKLLGKDGTETNWSNVKADVIGLYFSAHWCGPCRAFTPQLIKTYKKLKEDDKDFEIIFLSSDRDEKSMMEYYETMPWLTVPFGDKRKKKLSSAFDISGIPSLIVVKKDGEVITVQGRGMVSGDPDGKEFPWYPKPVNELRGATAGEINDCASLIWHTKSSRKDVQETLEGIAEEYLSGVKKGDKETLAFFFCSDDRDDDDIWDSLSKFANIPKKDETLTLINIPAQEVFVFSEDKPIDSDIIKKLLSDFNSGQMQSQPLKS